MTSNVATLTQTISWVDDPRNADGHSWKNDRRSSDAPRRDIEYKIHKSIEASRRHSRGVKQINAWRRDANLCDITRRRHFLAQLTIGKLQDRSLKNHRQALRRLKSRRRHKKLRIGTKQRHRTGRKNGERCRDIHIAKMIPKCKRSKYENWDALNDTAKQTPRVETPTAEGQRNDLR
jgi:hypothetical protein